MKKKAIKIAASTAVAASAFVAAAPAQQADAATNLEQLATNAANAGTVLKWAISKEGSADYQTRPYDEYNAAKKAIAALETAIEKLPTNQKLSYQAKLVEPKIQVNRALAYIDALTSGEKIRTKQAELQAAINNNDLKAVNEKYHILTAEIRKQAILLYDVYGESTRAGILAQFKAPAETLYRSVANDVTVYMHLDKASKLTSTDVVKASEELAKAQALLNDKTISFKWHAALTKNAADVATALPLQVVSVGHTGKNTVVVKFSKEYGAVLEAGQFTVNGVTVQSAALSADKKTVTLTTSTLAAAKEYTVTWKGAAVGKFTTAAEIDTRGIAFDQTALARLETSQTRTFESTLVNADNSAYVGPVVITLVDANGNPLPSTNPALITSLNGSTVASKALASNTDKNGKLVVTISAGANLDGASATGVYVKVTKDTNGNGTVETAEASTISAGTHFYKLASNDQSTGFKATTNFIDKDNDYIYDSATNKLKYKWDANDRFFIQNVLVTQAEFEAALSNGDSVTVDYKSNVNNVSSWNITEDVTIAGDVEITNPSKAIVTYDGVNYRLQGSGDAGYVVSVYRGTSNGGVYIDRATVDASGNWSVVVPNLVQNQSNVFTVYQHRAGDAVKSTDNKDTVTINEGAFASKSIYLNDQGDNGLSVTDTLEFTFINNDKGFNHEFKSGLTGTISVTDGLSRKAVFEVEYVNATTIKVVKVVSADQNFQNNSRTVTIEATTGLVNQDQLGFNVAASDSTTLGAVPGAPIVNGGKVTYNNGTVIDVNGKAYTFADNVAVRNELGLIEQTGGTPTALTALLPLNTEVFDVVTNANNEITSLKYKASADDKNAAAAVQKVIADLGSTPTATQVDSAKDKYDVLSDRQKALVTNYPTLAAFVSDIDAGTAANTELGALTTDSTNKAVKDARASYKALGTVGKAQVTSANLEKLTNAEKSLADAKTALTTKITEAVKLYNEESAFVIGINSVEHAAITAEDGTQPAAYTALLGALNAARNTAVNFEEEADAATSTTIANATATLDTAIENVTDEKEDFHDLVESVRGTN